MFTGAKEGTSEVDENEEEPFPSGARRGRRRAIVVVGRVLATQMEQVSTRRQMQYVEPVQYVGVPVSPEKQVQNANVIAPQQVGPGFAAVTSGPPPTLSVRRM